MKRLAIVGAGCAAGGLGIAVAVTGWLAVVAGGRWPVASSCGAGTNPTAVPAELRPLFSAASHRYALGPDGAAVLAGLTSVESGFGRNMGPSSAGAVGWTQFMPGTWKRYGVDADGDGLRDPFSAADAIFSAANYLHASGAPGDWHRALLTYNNAEWYVARVLGRARQLRAGGGGAACSIASVGASLGAARRVVGGGAIVPIPGQPGERIDQRLLPDVESLVATFHLRVTAGYAPTGHAADGEHPLGLAVDVVPGPGGSWDDVDRLAARAEPVQDHPRPPFRWVGYNDDPGHGRGNHLHLSWRHSAVPDQRPPAAWVEVFADG